MDLPIALRKGYCLCVKYHIANYVSYNALVSNSFFLHCIVFYFYSQQCVWSFTQPKWKDAMDDKMWDLEKKILGTLRIFLEKTKN